MAAVKMAKGDFVTNVYNDPKLIAEAEKKGFRLVEEKNAKTKSSPSESRKTADSKTATGTQE